MLLTSTILDIHRFKTVHRRSNFLDIDNRQRLRPVLACFLVLDDSNFVTASFDGQIQAHLVHLNGYFQFGSLQKFFVTVNTRVIMVLYPDLAGSGFLN